MPFIAGSNIISSRPLPACHRAHSMPKRAVATAVDVATPPPQQLAEEGASQASKQQKLSSGRSVAVLYPDWRLELFFKSAEDLAMQLPFLKQHGLSRLSITNKSADDDLLSVVAQLTAGFLGPGPQQQQQQQQQGSAAGVAAAGLDICVHYSLKYNYDKTPERSLTRLLDFCTALQQQKQQDLRLHVLLVSGGGKKKRFDTVAALQALQKHHHQQQQQQQQASGKRSNGTANATGLLLPSLAVAFNPYLPGEAEAAEERRRLKAKLQTGLVDGVYLQMGTDLQRLQSGLDYLQQLHQELLSSQPGSFKPPQLLGSVFLPSKRLLAQMRFRPWNGVFLSEQYLSSVEAAEGITRGLLAVYAAAGAVPLLESAVKTGDELQRAQQLLEAGGDVDTSYQRQQGTTAPA